MNSHNFIVPGTYLICNEALCLLNFIACAAPSISAAITANLNTPLMVGQTDNNTLTCGVTGTGNLNPMITYQWTRNDGTTVGTNSNMFTPSSVSLSDAGVYTCRATVSSDLLSNSIVRSDSQVVMIQSKLINQSGACTGVATMGPRGTMAPSLLSYFSIVSMSWFTFAIVSIMLWPPHLFSASNAPGCM